MYVITETITVLLEVEYIKAGAVWTTAVHEQWSDLVTHNFWKAEKPIKFYHENEVVYVCIFSFTLTFALCGTLLGHLTDQDTSLIRTPH